MTTLPSVSCICITRNRRVFLRQATSYFEGAAHMYGQLGGSAELVIVDGSDTSLALQHWPNRVRYHPRPGHILAAGISHNVACELATGDIIIQWDDDDWQSPTRIVQQVQMLLSAPGDSFAYTSQYYWYHLQERRGQRALSWDAGEGSTGATFAYWKDTWKKTPFEDVPICEDGPFFMSLRARGCPMLDAKDPSLLVYVRHNQNGSALTQYRWNDVDTRAARLLLDQDVDFYDGLGELLPVANWNHPNAPGSKMHVMTPLQQLWARNYR